MLIESMPDSLARRNDNKQDYNPPRKSSTIWIGCQFPETHKIELAHNYPCYCADFWLFVVCFVLSSPLPRYLSPPPPSP